MVCCMFMIIIQNHGMPTRRKYQVLFHLDTVTIAYYSFEEDGETLPKLCKLLQWFVVLFQSKCVCSASSSTQAQIWSSVAQGCNKNILFLFVYGFFLLSSHYQELWTARLINYIDKYTIFSGTPKRGEAIHINSPIHSRPERPKSRLPCLNAECNRILN